ncbi:MAG TPA: hypothetical protein VL403_03800 [Candidatus Kryptonia bacterium]|nr:hypothetical protein [Candidatus Kryptonia bacterium]
MTQHSSGAQKFFGPVNFVAARVANSFQAEGARFADAVRLSFDNMRIGKYAVFGDAASLGLGKTEIIRTGMTCSRIRVGTEPTALSLLESADFSADAYAQLEQSLRDQGKSDLANDVFVAKKWRERRETLKVLSPAWFGNLFIWALVRYGRSPEWALGWSALFVAIGCWLFRQKHMEPREPGGDQPYSAFWYSLDLFLPFVNLYAKDEWRPTKGRRFAAHYMRVHTLAGWILVPLGLAALSGIVK